VATRDLFHPRMLMALRDFYPSRCTIQVATSSQDSHGQERPTWATLKDHGSLPCAIGPSGGQEVERRDQTYARTTHRIALQGHSPLIDETMQAVVDDAPYTIVLVEHDSHSQGTSLLVELVQAQAGGGT